MRHDFGAVRVCISGVLLFTGAALAIVLGHDTSTDRLGFISLIVFTLSVLLTVCIATRNYRITFCGTYLVLTIFTLYQVLSSHYTVAIPRFMQQCLSSWHIGVIDLYDRIPERNGVYAFTAAHTGLPQRPDGTLFAKRFRAMPLDEIEVKDSTVFVNGKAVAKGFIHAPLLNKTPDDFERYEFLPPGTYQGFGDTYDSFDSRYWGNIDESQVIGRLHALF